MLINRKGSDLSGGNLLMINASFIGIYLK